MTPEYYMASALALAKKAAEIDEVPVGAVVVYENQIIGSGYNQCISLSDPTAHAEMTALRQAAAYLGNYRLVGCDLYVTLEPCAMCAGAMVHARIRHLTYGTPDPRTGAAGTVFNLTDTPCLNHAIVMRPSVLTASCQGILQDFFKAKRVKKT
jgi:tRNA(adenine34) deaminase